MDIHEQDNKHEKDKYTTMEHSYTSGTVVSGTPVCVCYSGFEHWYYILGGGGGGGGGSSSSSSSSSSSNTCDVTS